MKKHRFKRLIAACMLGVFSISCGLFGGGTEALASDEQPKTGSITIQNAIEGATYNFYRIADLTLTDSGDPEDGVSYTMSAEQYEKYGNYTGSYDSLKEAYDKLKDNPEAWDEEAAGMDYETVMKAYEEELASPITVNGVEDVEKVVWMFSETYITAFPIESESALQELQYKSSDYSFQTANGEVIADDLPLGYYIIISDCRCAPVEDAVIPINLTNMTADKVIKAKQKPIEIEKTANKNNLSAGEVVTYSIKGTIPVLDEDSTRILIADNSSGENENFLEYKQNFKLVIDGKEIYDQNTYPVEQIRKDSQLNNIYSRLLDNDVMIHDEVLSNDEIMSYIELAQGWYFSQFSNTRFGISIPYLPEYAGKPFEITYSAATQAWLDSAGLTNTAHMIIIEEVYEAVYEAYIVSDSNTVNSYSLNIYKYANGDLNKTLSGAQFVLYRLDENNNREFCNVTEDDLFGPIVTWRDIGDKTINQAIADGDITAVTSGQDGKAAFIGIPHDTYYLKEIKAPDGYNLLPEDKVVELGADAPADFEVQVENTGGALLPETGGPGTTLFIMMGLLLMAGASSIYLTHRKSNQS